MRYTVKSVSEQQRKFPQQDGKTLVCDKRDKAITCVFCRDLQCFLVLYKKICLL